jgi:hypothetical protein
MGIIPLARDNRANDPDNGASELPSRSRHLEWLLSLYTVGKELAQHEEDDVDLRVLGLVGLSGPPC